MNVAVVDAAAKRLLWEGIAEGRVKRKAMSNPAEAISRVIDQLFEEFPLPKWRAFWGSQAALYSSTLLRPDCLA